jgi:hypothetical protein
MSATRIRWIAVAMFAAVMTVAEVLAVQALARDARHWMSSDTAQDLKTAGRAVASVVSRDRNTAPKIEVVELAGVANASAIANAMKSKGCAGRCAAREARRTAKLMKLSWSRETS